MSQHRQRRRVPFAASTQRFTVASMCSLRFLASMCSMCSRSLLGRREAPAAAPEARPPVAAPARDGPKRGS